MVKHGQTIKIFLIDGEPNGRMTCELSNWTGKAYKIARTKVKDCKDRDELFKAGIYLLLGKDDNGKDKIYIGEAEQVLTRLNQHLSSKDFWNEVIVFISKDENLNKAHIKYLEHRLYEIALSEKRYVVENQTIPTKSVIAESDQADMELFLDNVKLLVSTLGHKVFERKREETKKLKNLFKIQGARGASATGIPNVDGFLVFKDSFATIDTVPSITKSFISLRERLLEQGVLVLQEDKYLFVEDYVFTSPSLAAATIMGRNANGLQEWKLSNGTCLKDFESLKDLS